MVLRGRGLDVTVSSLGSEPVGTGQMAHNERVFLEYEGDTADGTCHAGRQISFA